MASLASSFSMPATSITVGSKRAPRRCHRKPAGLAEVTRKGSRNPDRLPSQGARQTQILHGRCRNRPASRRCKLMPARTGECPACLMRHHQRCGRRRTLKGDVAFGLELYHAVHGHPDFGDLQLIAVTTPYRWPAAPGVPTVAERAQRERRTVSRTAWSRPGDADALPGRLRCGQDTRAHRAREPGHAGRQGVPGGNRGAMGRTRALVR